MAEVGYERTSIDATAARAQNYHLSALRLQRRISRGRHRKPAGRSTYQTLAPSGDMDALIPNAAQYVQSPLARQTIAMIISGIQ